MLFGFLTIFIQKNRENNQPFHILQSSRRLDQFVKWGQTFGGLTVYFYFILNHAYFFNYYIFFSQKLLSSIVISTVNPFAAPPWEIPTNFLRKMLGLRYLYKILNPTIAII